MGACVVWENGSLWPSTSEFCGTQHKGTKFYVNYVSYLDRETPTKFGGYLMDSGRHYNDAQAHGSDALHHKN